MRYQGKGLLNAQQTFTFYQNADDCAVLPRLAVAGGVS